MKDTYILAIESSCDDTSAAVLKNREVLSNVIANQSVHEEFGGVVPELASRAHQQNIIPVVDAAINRAGISKEQLSAIAFTRGPGLLGSLMVGTSFTKAFSMGLNIPMVEVDHMQAHMIAHLIEGQHDRDPEYPFLCLTVSGGHTQIVKVTSHLESEILGKTIDDAAGEAFDKAAKILSLGYPGGPVIDRLAKVGNDERFKFPIANMPEYQYSFSGLKTSFLYHVRDGLKENPNYIEDNKEDLCASIQKAIIDSLMLKLEIAVKETGINDVAIAGGVSANSGLRGAMEERRDRLGWNIFLPKFQYTTDNAAMIGIVGYYKYKEGQFAPLDIAPYARADKS